MADSAAADAAGDVGDAVDRVEYPISLLSNQVKM